MFHVRVQEKIKNWSKFGNFPQFNFSLVGNLRPAYLILRDLNIARTTDFSCSVKIQANDSLTR
jgi:hypothetical protein